jgi:hypothetical protein
VQNAISAGVAGDADLGRLDDFGVWIPGVPECSARRAVHPGAGLYLLVAVPELAATATGYQALVPDLPGLSCILVAVLCLAHAPRALSGRADTGVWSLTLVLLAAVAAVARLRRTHAAQ